MAERGVLSDKEIRARAERLVSGRALIHPFDEGRLRPAAYDVTVWDRALVTPDGTEIAADAKRGFDKPVTLHPGDMAKFSSYEVLRLPSNIAANMSLKSGMARQGLMLLSGMIIDPGYGTENDTDGRLHFYMANVGDQPVEITPMQTAVVAIQFLTVAGRKDSRLSNWPRRIPDVSRHGALGFIKDLKTVKAAHERFELDFARTKQATEWVILLGVFLVGSAILGITLQALLEFGTEDGRVRSIAAVIPDETAGKWLMGALAFSVSWALWSFALLARARARVETSAPLELQRRAEATRKLRFERDRNTYLAVTGLVILACTGAWAIDEFDVTPTFWPVWPILGGLLVGAVLWLWGRTLKPITESAVQAALEAEERKS